MKLHVSQLFDPDELIHAIKQKWVTERRHPKLPLRILNYAPACQFENIWTNITTQCRGLIIDDAGYVVARPFRKFWNLNTSYREETQEANLPAETPEVYDKMDGSLGIQYRYDGYVGIATRGSFVSDQAIWATDWLHRTYPEWVEWQAAFEPTATGGWTYLYEIVYPENHIVVDYPFEGLVLLSVIRTVHGSDEPWDFVGQCSWPGRRVERYQKSLSECMADQTKNREGYVLFYRKAGLRVKIKFTDYLRLHKLLTGVSPKVIWEMMRDKQDLNVFKQDVPDSFSHWVREWEGRMYIALGTLVGRVEEAWLNRPVTDSRKEMAAYFKQFPDIAGILFKMLDGNGLTNSQIRPLLYKQIKPEYGETDVYRKDEE